MTGLYKLLQIITALIFPVLMMLSCNPEPEDLLITREMLINEGGSGNAFHWFDEQNCDSVPVSAWFTPGVNSYWPAAVCIDLGNEFFISSIKLFDAEKSDFNGSNYEHEKGKLVISAGIPFMWKELKDYTILNNNKWHTIKLNVRTRYIQLKKISTKEYYYEGTGPYNCDLNIREVIFSGYKLKTDENKTTKVKIKENFLPNYTVDEFMGTNAYKSTPVDDLQPVGAVREYAHWKQNGVLSVKDSISWVNVPETGSFDSYYESIFKTPDLEVIPDFHRHVDEKNFGENKPNFDKDPEDPYSYSLIADYMFQFAARYGHSKVPDSLLRVKTGEPVFSGAGWINYYENWNEPDRWWGSPADHFTPYEYAAMSSATYDGHQGRMGRNFGIKQVDPEAKQVMAGISSLDFDYPRAIKLWSDFHREGSLPFDVLNFHHYCNSAGFQMSGPDTKGVSPEKDHLKEKLEKVVRQRDKYFPGMEVWVTEFGWDTFEGSIQGATCHTLYPDGISIFELQGIWIVRGYLAGAAAGIDRFFMYQVSDIKGDGLFKNCGFVKVDGEKKPSWYYTLTMKNCLKGMRFENEIDSENKKVLIYQFKKQGEVAYVLWCPTDDGSKVPGYIFSVSGKNNSNKIVVTRLSDNKPDGIKESYNLSNGRLVIDVTEKPVFVNMFVDSK